MVISVWNVPITLILIKTVSVKMSVISVKLGMKKLELVSAVSRVMDIQLKVYAAALQ